MYRPRVQQYVETNRAFGPYLPPLPLQGIGSGIFNDKGVLGSLGAGGSAFESPSGSCGAAKTKLDEAARTFSQITSDFHEIQNRADNDPENQFQQAAAAAAQAAYNQAAVMVSQAQAEYDSCQSQSKQQAKVNTCDNERFSFNQIVAAGQNDFFPKIAQGDKAALDYWNNNLRPQLVSIANNMSAAGCTVPAIPQAPELAKIGPMPSPPTPPKPEPCVTGTQLGPDGKCAPPPSTGPNWWLILGVGAALLGIGVVIKKKMSQGATPGKKSVR